LQIRIQRRVLKATYHRVTNAAQSHSYADQRSLRDLTQGIYLWKTCNGKCRHRLGCSKILVL